VAEKENIASFVLYCDWEDIIEELTDEEVGQLFKAIFAYVNREDVVHFDGRSGVGVAFKTICKQIDVNRRKYEQIVEKRRNAANKRWKNKSDDMQSNAKNANAYFAMHNVNVNENENDNDNVSVNVNGNERNENVNDNVSPSADDFSAVELSADQLSGLVSFSSQQTVDFYISKARDWQIKHKRKYKNAYATIKGWIEAEKAKNPVSSDRRQSFDISKLEEQDRNFVRNGGNDSG
jgi:hypothetical protein